MDRMIELFYETSFKFFAKYEKILIMTQKCVVFPTKINFFVDSAEIKVYLLEFLKVFGLVMSFFFELKVFLSLSFSKMSNF